MIKNKSPIVDIFLLTILILISVYLSLRGSILDSGIITTFDFPVHYFSVWRLEKEPSLAIRTPKLFPTLLTIAIKNIFSINLPLTFRIIVLTSFLLPPTAIFLLAKKLLSPEGAFFSSLLWLASVHTFFLYGNFVDYFALGLCFFFVFFFVDYTRNKKKRQFYISVIILNLLILTHLVYSGLFLVFLMIYLVITFRKKCFQEIMKLLLFSLPALLMQIHFFFMLKSLPESTFYGQFNILTNLTESFPDTLLIVLLGIAAIIYTRKGKQKILNSMVISSMILILLLFFIVLLSDMLMKTIPPPIIYYLIRKPVLFIRFLMVIPATYFFIKLLENRRIITGSLVMLSLSLFLILNFTLIHEFWANPNDPTLFNKFYYNFKGSYPINFTGGVFSYSPVPGIMEAFEWLKENGDGNILVEDVNDRRFGGFFMITAPIYTNKSLDSFKGRLLPTIPPTGKSTFLEKDIEKYGLEEFKELLDKDNITHIVVWSNFTIPHDGIIRHVKSFGDIKIYEYLR